MNSLYVWAYTVIDVLLGASITVFLCRRNLAKRFPVFLSYVAYSTLDIVVTVGLFWWKGDMAYFQAYWYSEIGQVLLALWAMMESLFEMFAGYGRFRWFRWLLWMSAWTALAYGAWKALAYPPVDGYWLTSLVISVELIFQYWLMSIGILFFGLMLFFGIPVQQRECWIVLGFLTESFFTVGGFLLRSVFGARYPLLSSTLPGIGHIVAKCIWLIGIARRDESFYVPPKIEGLRIETMITILDRQIDVLKQLLRWRPRHKDD